MSQTNGAPESGPPPSIPGWVKMFGIIVLVLIAVYIILHLTGLAPTGVH